MSAVTIREATAADAAAVLTLNNASTPHVNALSDEECAWLVAHAANYRVAEEAGGIAGFVLCLPAGTDYWSDNYKWFAARYADYLYLDRVIVAPHARRAGVGRALYNDLHRTVQGRWPRVTLEVNLRPPNPTSVTFHERMGYIAVGTREYDDGAKAVHMFTREL